MDWNDHYAAPAIRFSVTKHAETDPPEDEPVVQVQHIAEKRKETRRSLIARVDLDSRTELGYVIHD